MAAATRTTEASNTASTPCACEPAGAKSARRRAVGVDPALKRANLNHLRRIEGQVRGVAAMIEQDRSCADIITQVSAVRESLHAVARNLMRNHLRHCASAAIREGDASRDAMVDELLDLVGKVAR